jgi:hypothetical protein
MLMTDLHRRVRLLTISSIGSWALVGLLVYVVLISDDRLRVTEISAERVNIISPQGDPVMVLAHRHRIPGPSMNGVEYSPALADGRDQQSGIIFFNDQGDEVGGLIYNGIPANDSSYWAGGHFSFDQWKQNQVVAMQYLDNSRSRRAGLRVWDRPTDRRMSDFLDAGQAFVESHDSSVQDSLRRVMRGMRERGDLGVERLFVGSQNAVAQIQLRGTDGKMRARLYVDSTNTARLEFLNAQGTVTAALTNEGQ